MYNRICTIESRFWKWPLPSMSQPQNHAHLFDQHDLIKIANYEMPFGRFKGTRLIRLPEEYLLWFVDRGFPSGKLGELMQITLEIKINGLEKLIYPLQEGRIEAPPGKTKHTFDADS